MAMFMMDPVHAMVANPATMNPSTGFANSRTVGAPTLVVPQTGMNTQYMSTESAEYDRACIVYVGGLTERVEDRSLFETFCQFGDVLSVVRRSVVIDSKQPGHGQQYAFIRYGHPQEALSAIEAGEVIVDGRKVLIKPRDPPGPRPVRKQFNGPSDLVQLRNDIGRQQLLNMLHNNAAGASHADIDTSPATTERIRANNQARNPNYPFAQPHLQQQVTMPPGIEVATNNASQAMPMFMSKSLNISNVPADMTPKELFDAFNEVGEVEGCYIFPYLDWRGRRFGYVVMSSFYHASKAIKAFHGQFLRNFLIEVTYQTIPFHHPQVPAEYSLQAQAQFHGAAPTVPQQMFYPQVHQPQQQTFGWSPTYAAINAPQGVVAPIAPFGQQYVQLQAVTPVIQVPYGYNPSALPMSSMEIPAQKFGNSPPLPPPGLGFGAPHINKRQGNIRLNRGNRSAPGQPGSANSTLRPESSATSTDAERLSRCLSGSSLGTTLISFPNDDPRIASSPGSLRQSTGKNHSMNAATTRADGPSHTARPEIAKPASSKFTDGAKKKPCLSFSPSIIPEAPKPADPCNLFIKNLDDRVVNSSDALRRLFEPFGTVTSAHLPTYPDSDVPRGHGFIAFAKAEDASKAKDRVNQTMIGKKRVFVSYAERKEDRAKRLKTLFETGVNAMPEGEKDAGKKDSQDPDDKKPPAVQDIRSEATKSQETCLKEIGNITTESPKAENSIDVSPDGSPGPSTPGGSDSLDTSLISLQQDLSLMATLDELTLRDIIETPKSLATDVANENALDTIGADQKLSAIATTLALATGGQGNHLSRKVDEEVTDKIVPESPSAPIEPSGTSVAHIQSSETKHDNKVLATGSSGSIRSKPGYKATKSVSKFRSDSPQQKNRNTVQTPRAASRKAPSGTPSSAKSTPGLKSTQGPHVSVSQNPTASSILKQAPSPTVADESTQVKKPRKRAPPSRPRIKDNQQEPTKPTTTTTTKK